MTSLCDFVFQHRYGKKWISYSDTEIENMNKALRRKQKTVTLPGKDSKKHIVVNFETMLQKNNVSNVEQCVRALIYTKEFFHSWMWQDDDDEYVSYRPFQVYFLEAAFHQKLDEVRFYDSGDYIVDLKKLREINEDTSESRLVVRQKIDLVYTARIEEIAHQSKVLCDQMKLNESLICLLKERRIFDPAISSLVTPAKSSSKRTSSDFIQNVKRNCEDFVLDSVNKSVDKDCPDFHDYKVYSAGKLFFSAVLSYTSIESNTNKYLVMQILTKGKKFFLWHKWGRIGNKTQAELKDFGAKIADAEKEFEDKFYDKTRNEWQDVMNFKHVSGKYDLLKMDLSLEVEEASTDVESRLPKQVQNLLSMITSRRMMNQIMEDMEFDLKQSPFGKLTTTQIKDGYTALSKIADEISRGGKGKDLISTCDEFYTKIPHNFGRKKPPIILTQEDVEEKIKMLEALFNINIAVNVMNETYLTAEHPLDRYYKSLDCSLEPLDHSSAEFEAIQTALFGTCGPTHTSSEMGIDSIFVCNKQSEDLSYANIKNKYLLWHGSRLTNWIGILKEGLRIAPTEAPSTGSMFGKGLYFADVSSKSANYCFPNKKQNVGLIVLCEVCLGNSLELFHCVENMPQFLPSGYESVIGKGKYKPTGFKTILPGEAKLPVGPLVEDSKVLSSLMYNEYVVYSSKQVKLKYLILVKFNFN